MIDTQRQNLNSDEPDPSPKLFPHCTPESLGGTQVSLNSDGTNQQLSKSDIYITDGHFSI